MNLDTKMHPLNFSIVGMGNVNITPISITNIFKSAVLSNSASEALVHETVLQVESKPTRIMLFHNHPSGDVTPSLEDRHLTQKLMEACRIMDIPLVDHVIIGGTYGHRYSFKESSDLFVDMPQAKGVREEQEEYNVKKPLSERIAEKKEKTALSETPEGCRRKLEQSI